jgi:hypothetical protein
MSTNGDEGEGEGGDYAGLSVVPTFAPTAGQRAVLRELDGLLAYWGENEAGDEKDWNHFQGWLEREDPALADKYFVFVPGMALGVNVALRADMDTQRFR